MIRKSTWRKINIEGKRRSGKGQGWRGGERGTGRVREKLGKWGQLELLLMGTAMFTLKKGEEEEEEEGATGRKSYPPTYVRLHPCTHSNAHTHIR